MEKRLFHFHKSVHSAQKKLPKIPHGRKVFFSFELPPSTEPKNPIIIGTCRLHYSESEIFCFTDWIFVRKYEMWHAYEPLRKMWRGHHVQVSNDRMCYVFVFSTLSKYNKLDILKKNICNEKVTEYLSFTALIMLSWYDKKNKYINQIPTKIPFREFDPVIRTYDSIQIILPQQFLVPNSINHDLCFVWIKTCLKKKK